MERTEVRTGRPLPESRYLLWFRYVTRGIQFFVPKNVTVVTPREAMALAVAPLKRLGVANHAELGALTRLLSW
jgi:hypothetical protein